MEKYLFFDVKNISVANFLTWINGKISISNYLTTRWILIDFMQQRKVKTNYILITIPYGSKHLQR